MRPIRDHLPSLALLLALPVLLLLPALLPGHALLPAAMLGRMLPWQGSASYPANPPFNPLLFDGTAQFYPWRLFAARTWASGYVPLWNPYQFCGTPFLANDQSAVLYPLNLIFLIMPVARAFAASAVLHLFLTGSFLYFFLRRHCGIWPSLLGAITWQLSAWQVSWLALPTFLCTSAWIPLGLLLVERSADAPKFGRSVALGCCLGVMLLAGHLQIALYGLIFCAAYGLMLLVREMQPAQRAALARSYAGSALIALLLAAPQLLPTVELARVSHRAAAHATFTGYAGYVGLAMPWYRLVTLFSPSFFGRAYDYWDRQDIPYPETACFVGIAALLLACFAAFRAWDKKSNGLETRRSRFFAIAAIVVLLFALGTPLNLITYFGIPGFSQSGSPARSLVLWTLSLAILAAYGLEALLRGESATKRAPVYTWLAILAVPLVAAVLFVERQSPDYLRLIDRPELLASLVIAACALPLTLRLRQAPTQRERAIIAPALILLVVVDLFRAGYGFNTAATLAQVYPVTPAIAFLQRQTQSANGEDRIVVLNAPEGVYQLPGVLPPNAATVYGLRDLQGYDSLQTGQYKAYLNRLNANHDSSPLENGNMDLTHYEAAVSMQAASQTDAEWIVSPVALGSAPQQAAGDTVKIYRQPAPTYGRAWTSGAVNTPALLTDQSPTRQTIQAKAQGDLIVADQYYPGWNAKTADGLLLPLLKSPQVFRTIPDVAANQQVKLAYSPESFLVGLYFACTAILAIGIALGRAAVRSKRLV